MLRPIFCREAQARQVHGAYLLTPNASLNNSWNLLWVTAHHIPCLAWCRIGLLGRPESLPSLQHLNISEPRDSAWQLAPRSPSLLVLYGDRKGTLGSQS